MCRPTNVAPTARRVIIAGAGPAGLLLQALLHNRNKAPNARVFYDVTLLESRPDLGQLTEEELKANHRSWMIGLAGHGLEAVRSVPGLYEEYIREVGVMLTEGGMILGSKKLTMGQPNKNDTELPEGFIVDRNFIVAALARYAKDKMAGSPHYTPMYETELLYVDADNHRVLVRNTKTKEEEYLPYDLLVGADGVRSTVREALVKKHWDFELQVSDIFQTFKAVHIALPESLSPTSLYYLPGCLPSFNGIVLPETGNVINLSMGVTRNRFDSLPDDIKSNDPEVVAKFFKENFKAFQLTEESYMDLAEQWVGQRWNRTGQVYCNRYSSLECKAIIMGDAAHATSPSIGMGMNTALRDAQKLHELLEQFDDDLEKVLPQFSKDRVPEGNSLTNIAYNLFCFDQAVTMKSMVKSVIRSGFHYVLPSLVAADPQTLIGRPEYSLSEIYEMAHSTISKHSEINKRIRHEHFERETGMVKEKSGASWTKFAMVGVPVVACAVAAFFNYQ